MDASNSFCVPDIPALGTQVPTIAETSAAPKRLRACIGCREQKLRCELTDQSPEASCERCLKTGRQCIVPPAPKYRPRATGKSRFEVLERRFNALVATLEGRREGPGIDDNEKDIPGSRRNSREDEALSSTNTRLDGDHTTNNNTQSRQHFASPSSARKDGNGKRSRTDDFDPFSFFMKKPLRKDELFNTDVISRGHLPLADAERIYHRFLHHMLPHLPLVVLPEGITLNELRRTKPTLFLAILAVGSGILSGETKDMLVRESMTLLADRLIIRGEKDLDIIQAIQVSVVWYHAPERFQEVKIYQLIHIAATMAIDLGYGEHHRPTKSKLSSLGLTPSNNPIHSVGESTDTVEERQRALLGCYFLCGYVAMTSRRPSMLRWIPYMEFCVSSLTDTRNALEADKILCHWVRGQCIAEAIAINLRMDDPSETFDGSDVKLQYILAGFEQQLERWRSQISPKLHNHLRSYFNTINLYLHETVLHVGHNIHDFRPPFLDETLSSASSSDTPQSLSLVQLNSIATCIVSAQSLLEDFLGYDTETIWSLPVFFFVRTAYAAFALLKIHQMTSEPDGRFGMIDKESLKIEDYIQRVLYSLQGVIDGKSMRIASAVHLVLQIMALWLQKQSQATTETSSKDSTHLLQPLVTPESEGHQVEFAANQTAIFSGVNNPGTSTQSVSLPFPHEFEILEPSPGLVDFEPLDVDFSSLFNLEDGRFFETAIQWFGV